MLFVICLVTLLSSYEPSHLVNTSNWNPVHPQTTITMEYQRLNPIFKHFKETLLPYQYRSIIRTCNLHRKLVTRQQSVVFLNTCKKYQILPNFIQVKLQFQSLRSQKIKSYVQLKLLQASTYDQHQFIRILHQQCQRQLQKCASFIPPVYIVPFLKYLAHLNMDVRSRVQCTHLKKVQNLLRKQRPELLNLPDTTRYVINNSSLQLTANQMQVLQYDLKFKPTSNYPQSVLQFIARLESCLYTHPHLAEIRSTATRLLRTNLPPPQTSSPILCKL
jgi:hypothetical protein